MAGPASMLGLRPVRAVGAVSYSLYLWHWPLIVAAEAQFGELSPMAGLAAVLAAVVPAILTYKLVENPLRRSAALTACPVRAIQLGAVCTVLPAVGGLLLYYAVWPAIRPTPPLARDFGVTAAGSSAPAAAGANVLGKNPRGDRAGAAVDRVASVWPDPFSVRADLPAAYRDGCVPSGITSELRPCEYGVRDAATTVVLAGDSHAGHWLPALEEIANQKRWRLVVHLRNSCPFLDVEVALPRSEQPFKECTEWNRELRSVLTGAQRPDLLLTSGTLYQPVRAGKALVGDVRCVSAADEEAPAPLVLRRSWNRFDKLWWFGSTMFYGLPCAAGMLGSGGAGGWWAFALIGFVWIGFGWFNWRIRAVDSNRLIAEVTAGGIRFSDDQRLMPWSEVAWVGRLHTSAGTWGPPSHDYLVLHRHNGSEVMRRLDVDIWPVTKAILRLAPQVPVSEDDHPPR